MAGVGRESIAGLRGTFRVGSLVKQKNHRKEDVIELGTLRVFPADGADEKSRAGQWVFSIAEDAKGNFRESFFIEVASRLGLVPVRFTRSIENILRSDAALCIVADTNTLYHGTLAQALRLREGRATHVAIADVAMMEMQRQREKGWTSSSATKKSNIIEPAATDVPAPPPSPEEAWSRSVIRSRSLSAGGRALERLRKAGHVVHIARPEAAKVRYFGGSRDTADNDDGGGDGDIVGSNLLRDRLVLEAVFQQRVDLPGVQVVLLTDDALLAEQAKIEGITVGFGWLANKIEPRILTSPHIDPRTLELRHVPLEDLIDELVWSCSTITLQRENEGKMLVARAPEDKREHVLAAMGEPGYEVKWTSHTSEVWAATAAPRKVSTASTATVAPQSVPKKAPTAAKLVERLLWWTLNEDEKAPKEAGPEDAQVTDAYLEALGWLTRKTDFIINTLMGEAEFKALTVRGWDLASRWRSLEPQHIQEWADWLTDTSSDFAHLAPLQSMLKHVSRKPGATDKALVLRSGDSEDTIGRQMNLSAPFGVTIRLSAKNWAAAQWTQDDAERAILDGIEKAAVSSSSGLTAVPVARLFTSFLKEKAMSLPVFRAALDRLRRAGRVRFGGSSPEKSGVKMRVLEPLKEAPFVAVRDVDLGEGNFLLPGIPTCVVEVVSNGAVKQEDV